MVTANAITNSRGNISHWYLPEGTAKSTLAESAKGFFGSETTTKQIKFEIVRLSEALSDDKFSLVALEARKAGLQDDDFVKIGLNRTARYLKEIDAKNGWLRTWAERRYVVAVNRQLVREKKE